MAELNEDGDGEEAVVWGSAYPPSINAGIPKLGQLPAGWSRLRMNDMLDVIERPLKLDDSKSYQLVTAKRSRGGIVSRGTLRGDEIKVKQQFEVKAGDFILSNRQIAHGGCGIVPKELDGAIVSGEYTVLHPKPLLDLRFLHYLSHSAHFQQICFHSGVGVHVEKLVFRLHDWLNWQTDIPPLAEQRRIAEILCDFDRAIEATDTLVEAKQRRKRALTHRLFGDAHNPFAIVGDELGKLSSIQYGSGVDPASYCSDGPSWVIGTSGIMGFSKTGTKTGPAIILGRKGTLNRPFFVPDGQKFSAIDTTFVVTTKQNLKALYHFLTYLDLSKLNAASGVPSVSSEALKAQQVPTLTAFQGELLDSIDAEIEQLNAQASRIRKQRRGLMQRLLSPSAPKGALAA